MTYDSTVPAVFQSRPNRFVAQVLLNGQPETVHVKNTSRCRELLVPGAAVILQRAAHSKRKTKYDLIAVQNPNLGWVNIDSQAPNHVVREWLETKGFSVIQPEYRYGQSRIDFYMERDGHRYLLEVKGCTLEIDGIGYFPDAPTERGVRHLRELTQAIGAGYQCAVAFVIAMEGVDEVRPNVATHPAFGVAFEEARGAGVKILALGCTVTENTLTISRVREL